MITLNNPLGFLSDTVDTIFYSPEEKAMLIAQQQTAETANQNILAESKNMQETIVTSLIIISAVAVVILIINKIF